MSEVSGNPQGNGLNVQLPGIAGNWGQGLAPREVLIPAYLKPAGYATGCFGKWNIGFAPGTRPTEEGFDEFIGSVPGQIDYYSYKYQGKHGLYRGTEEYQTDKYATDLRPDATIDFIRRHAGQPFFVYLPFNAPHSPDPSNYAPGEPIRYRVPEKYLKLYGSDAGEPNDRIRYFATISAMDDAFGRVLRALDDLGLRDDTLVVFFNDNGANTGREHGLKFATNAPYRGGRPDCWEDGIRVPAIFRWPGRLPKDVDCDAPLIATDVLPMILAAAGVAAPAGRVLDGVDPTAILAGRARAGPRAGLEVQRARGDPAGAVQARAGGAHPGVPALRAGRRSGERRNLAAREPAVAARLARAYQDWLNDTRRERAAAGPGAAEEGLEAIRKPSCRLR